MDNSKNPNPFKCEICEKYFKKSNGLKYHFKVVHNLERQHHCNICQKAFDSQSKLTRHMKLVHENKKCHECDSCGKSFPRAESLKFLQDNT